ncbi:Sin3 binding domain-containing protein isoform 1 [Cladophialophora immunda]|nr:Sin3 binding domain-containing protein isoform 1 [Cladophialophora immunda]
MSVPILRSYRIAHRLHVPAAFNYPHAEVTYKSCELALRAPSAVHYRRKLHEQQLQRRKQRQLQQTSGTGKNNNSKDRDKEKGKSKETANTDNPSTAQTGDTSEVTSSQGQAHRTPTSPSSSSSTTSNLGPREPASNLASAVRKHFNAQQLNEADTLARFIYVVQQNGRQVRTEGSEGDGRGSWMGSQGRAARKSDAPWGDVGFRLRFRP